MNLGVIQARMNSARLPGKVLMPIKGIPMLLIMTDRAKVSKRIDRLVVATSKELSDNAIERTCLDNAIECFRGSLDDVLDRFFQLSQIYYPANIVRLTGDCPLIDPDIIDATVSHHIAGGYDYTRNYGFPDGLDVEVMTHAALATAFRDADSAYEREHVTPYLYNNPQIFKCGRYHNGHDISHIKVSVDTEDDFYRVSKIIDFCLCSTLELLRNS